MDIVKWLAVGLLVFYVIAEPDLIPIVGWDDGLAGAAAAYLFTKG